MTKHKKITYTHTHTLNNIANQFGSGIKLDNFFILTEPFQHHQQQTVVWPTTYTQPQTAIQAAPHLLMPPIAAAQTMQASSLTPLLLGAPDYLSASTTLHQVRPIIQYEFISVMQLNN